MFNKNLLFGFVSNGRPIETPADRFNTIQLAHTGKGAKKCKKKTIGIYRINGYDRI